MSVSRANEGHPAATKTHYNHSDKEDVVVVEDGKLSKKAAVLSLLIHLLPWINRMINLCKDLAIMLLVAFTYAALMNEPPKVTKSPPAYPFFARNSTIRDYYKGQISLATEHARAADISFVMFYAPWDAESQAVRRPFEEAAQLMQNRVAFAAVNCWQPGGECRNQYSKVYKWPVLIAYAVHSRGVQYNGPYETHHFVRFLNAVARPFVRVANSEELDHLIANYDATVITYINASPKQYDYAVLYTAALKLLEKDPFQEIPFAICTVARQERPLLELHLWNESWVYPEGKEWLSEHIVEWIFKKIHQVTLWFLPPGMKSRQLSSYLQPGPALILFTPRNPLWEHTDIYSMFREIGLEYYNCNNDWKLSSTQNWLKKSRIKNYITYKETVKHCRLNMQKATDEQLPVVVTYSMKKWDNSTPFDKDDNFCDGPSNSIAKPCPHNKYAHDEEAYCSKQSHVVDTDERSAFNLERIWQEERCHLLKSAQKYQPAIYSSTIVNYVDYGKKFNRLNVSGLACETNASLTLIAMDSLLHYHFAERLGVNVSNRKDKTVAVIVNDKHEVHHIMEGAVNDFTLRQFIYNFTKHTLIRSLDNPKLTKNNTCSEYACIEELNTQNFLSTVMQTQKAVVVLYHSKQCFFCNGVSHIFLTASQLLKNTTFLQFARIDGDLNNLPWQYTMEKYPTILLFPVHKKSESRIFPRNMAITVDNLINFILANLEGNCRIPVMWTLCSQTKFVDEKDDCTREIRLEILNLIDKNLMQWRRALGRAKAVVLRRLKLLKSLHLLLACSPHDDNEIRELLKSLVSL